MKIQYCSDLHLEFSENKNFLERYPLVPEGEILVLAGDIALFRTMKEHDDFFDFCSANFKTTYWLPGNHEYYQSSIGTEDFNPVYREIKKNVFLLNNHTVIYNNAELIFSTLWSHIPPQHEWTVQKSVSDFTRIKFNGYSFTPSVFNSLHENGYNFLKAETGKPTGKHRIIVTHHVPTQMHYPEQYRNSSINCAFATELFSFIENCRATYWIYGHHHCNTPPFTIGYTTLLTNQLGYVMKNEHQTFNHCAILEI